MAELIISTDKNGFVQVPLTTYKGYQETILQNIPDGEQEVVTKKEISDFANSIVNSVNENFRTFINQQRENMEMLAKASENASNTSNDKSTVDTQENATSSPVDTSTSVSENNPQQETVEQPVEQSEPPAQEPKVQPVVEEQKVEEVSLEESSTGEGATQIESVEINPVVIMKEIIDDSLMNFSNEMMVSFSQLLSEKNGEDNTPNIQEPVVVEPVEEQVSQQNVQNEIIENIDNSVVTVETNNIQQVEQTAEPEVIDVSASIGNIKSEVASVVSDLLSSVELSNTVMVQALEQSSIHESLDYIHAGIEDIKAILTEETDNIEEPIKVPAPEETVSEQETITQQTEVQPENVENTLKITPEEVEKEEVLVQQPTEETVQEQPTQSLADRLMQSTPEEEKEIYKEYDYDINSILEQMAAEDAVVQEQLNIFNNNIENVSLRDDSELAKYLRETYDMAPLTEEYEKAVSIMEKIEQTTVNDTVNNNDNTLNENQFVQETVNNQSTINNQFIKVENNQPPQQIVQQVNTDEILSTFKSNLEESTTMIISAIQAMKQPEETKSEVIQDEPDNFSQSKYSNHYIGRQAAERIGV